MEATCSAPINIAVIKYWGKRDTDLILPTNSSLSLTLEELKSTTTIRISGDDDQIYLNGKKEAIGTRMRRVIDEMKQLRAKLELGDAPKLSDKAICIMSENNFPTAAGLI
jgi:diphosphomevalonate decarboxylase